MSSSASNPVLHRCSVCFKTYKRREHLQRHRTSHTSERPHRCVLCNASFQRTDVLKRHLQTCDGTPASTAGRRRACDRCVRSKKACSSSHPCENCARRGLECQYSNITPPTSNTQIEANPSIPTTEQHQMVQAFHAPPAIIEHHEDFNDPIRAHFGADFDALIQEAVSEFPLFAEHDAEMHGLSHDWLGTHFSDSTALDETSRPDPSCSSLSDYHGYSFNFLYDFTSRTGLVSSFDCGTLSQRLQVLQSFHYPYQTAHNDGLSDPSFNPFENVHGISILDDNLHIHHDITASLGWDPDPAAAQMDEIIMLVKEVVTVKPSNSTVTHTWSPALEDQCRRFFSPPRFARFIEFYWAIWHPNVNIIHRPSFDVLQAKPILLAGMALIGACVSPDPIDNEDAKMWFNCVEEMVFTDIDFCSDSEPNSPIDDRSPAPDVLASKAKIQALQASYLVCLFQNWEGNDRSKRRIRRNRFSTVVSVARDMGIAIARHPDYTHQGMNEFVWAEFVAREEAIRTFLWIFLLDAAFVIFNNTPHRIVIKEMGTHLASPEACFQALSAQECLDEIHRWMPQSSPFADLLLREVIETVCCDHLEPAMQQNFAQLGPLNLFVVVSVLHYIIFQHQNLFGVEGQLVPIRNGLRNWIAMWELYFDTWSFLPPHGMVQEDALTPDTMWKRVGFVRHTPEYWLLGSLLTDRIASNTSGAQEERGSQNDLDHGSSSASSGKVAKTITRTPILDKYDQTSMRQVNELITDFQRVQME
ncbi:hypothetical protein QBC37DRAFT_54248 [Rhypophila decipiens]|uniref:Uncharacterized protein n=1 Tax=Rhypophila decipiens TaxID=261697 RepID=A0AAN7B3D6_9PEZI|nr:hypothetical protein QBC37DRAFT_54248 [Rhypophila decipiens]